MSAAGSEPPRYDFTEEESFAEDKKHLGLPDERVDAQLWAIQDSIAHNPLQEPWSRPLGESGLRTAVSDGTDFFADALRVIYRVDGGRIRLMHVEHRDVW